MTARAAPTLRRRRRRSSEQRVKEHANKRFREWLPSHMLAEKATAFAETEKGSEAGSEVGPPSAG